MIQWKHVQERLGVVADGRPGPQTYAALFTAVAGRQLATVGMMLARSAAENVPLYAVDTPLRLPRFLGQTCLETGYYRFLREIWGPTPAQLRYESREDLGNDQPGDGRRFLGRGLFQITGRDNYRQVGRRLGLDLENKPQLAEEPGVAVLTALDWWRAHGCSAFADAGDDRGLSRLINRGDPRAKSPANHEPDRLALTARAIALLA